MIVKFVPVGKELLEDYNWPVEAYVNRMRQRLAWVEVHPFALDLMACAETNS